MNRGLALHAAGKEKIKRW